MKLLGKKREHGIKILGLGRAKCMELEKATRAAISYGKVLSVDEVK